MVEHIIISDKSCDRPMVFPTSICYLMPLISCHMLHVLQTTDVGRPLLDILRNCIILCDLLFLPGFDVFSFLNN